MTWTRGVAAVVAAVVLAGCGGDTGKLPMEAIGVPPDNTVTGAEGPEVVAVDGDEVDIVWLAPECGDHELTVPGNIEAAFYRNLVVLSLTQPGGDCDDSGTLRAVRVVLPEAVGDRDVEVNLVLPR